MYEEGSKQKEGNRRRELPSVNTGGRLSCSSLFGWLAEARRTSSRKRWYVSLEQRWWLPLMGSEAQVSSPVSPQISGLIGLTCQVSRFHFTAPCEILGEIST